MAQLKLMKKEWFDWFKNTTLDNITAWTEYYYINPDTQHWISNNLALTTYASIVNFVIADVKPNTTYTLRFTRDTSTGYNIIIKDSDGVILQFVTSGDSGKTITFTTTSFSIDKSPKLHFNGYSSGTNTSDIYLVVGESIPPVFNPPLIKIEDILGVVAMKDLSWTYEGNNIYEASRASLPSDMPSYSPDESNPAKIFNPTYKAVRPALIFQSQTDMAIGLSGVIRVKDKRVSSLSDYLNLIQDQYLVYMKVDSPYI